MTFSYLLFIKLLGAVPNIYSVMNCNCLVGCQEDNRFMPHEVEIKFQW